MAEKWTKAETKKKVDEMVKVLAEVSVVFMDGERYTAKAKPAPKAKPKK